MAILFPSANSLGDLSPVASLTIFISVYMDRPVSLTQLLLSFQPPPNASPLNAQDEAAPPGLGSSRG